MYSLLLAFHPPVFYQNSVWFLIRHRNLPMMTMFFIITCYKLCYSSFKQWFTHWFLFYFLSWNWKEGVFGTKFLNMVHGSPGRLLHKGIMKKVLSKCKPLFQHCWINRFRHGIYLCHFCFQIEIDALGEQCTCLLVLWHSDCVPAFHYWTSTSHPLQHDQCTETGSWDPGVLAIDGVLKLLILCWMVNKCFVLYLQVMKVFLKVLQWFMSGHSMLFLDIKYT